MTETIYILLLDEGIDVWRPVTAKKITETIYEILEDNDCPNTEKWEFQPGQKVICKILNISDGQILAAVALYDPKKNPISY